MVYTPSTPFSPVFVLVIIGSVFLFGSIQQTGLFRKNENIVPVVQIIYFLVAAVSSKIAQSS
jgi:cytochrome c oxidase assembly factor CtaG